MRLLSVMYILKDSPETTHFCDALTVGTHNGTLVIDNGGDVREILLEYIKDFGVSVDIEAIYGYLHRQNLKLKMDH